MTGRRLDEAVHGADAGAGEQVVGERVAGEALDAGEQRQDGAEDPVDLTRLAEGAGEEHAGHVHEDRDDEDQGGPVVDLPDEQAAADVEGDPERRAVGVGHRHALQRDVGAVVDDLGGARDEPEREEGAGQQADDHRVHRDLAEHERPVVGEDLLGEEGDALRAAEAVVHPTGDAAEGLGGGGVLVGLAVAGAECVGGTSLVDGAHRARSQKLGPTGSAKPCGGDEVSRVVDGDLELRQGPLGRAEDDGAVLGEVEGRLVARAEQVVRLLLVQADRAAHVGADLGVGDDAVDAPVLGLLHLDQVGVEADQDDRRLGLGLEDVLALVDVLLERLGHDVEDGAVGDLVEADRASSPGHA